MIRFTPAALWAGLPLIVCLTGTAGADDLLSGYATYETFRQQVAELDELDRVSVDVIGKTAGDRDVCLVTVGGGGAEARPAVLVMGAIAASDLAASDVTLGMARRLARRADRDENVAKLLDEVTFYFIPRPSPDATEQAFVKPYTDRTTNDRATDDDRDGTTDEDPSEDLNDDGLITMLRVEDPDGEWIPHPDEPRIMIKADREKGEQGRYRLLSEGVDNDGDEQWNEDGRGGVDFNKNFTFDYPYFAAGAGPHQVSEPESRAVAGFAYGHTNIYLVLSFAPQHNLIKPWSPGNNDAGPIKTTVHKDDVMYLKMFAERYGKLVKTDGAPDAVDAAGSFVPWAYYHYGRWSLSAPAWWVPPSEEKQEAAEKEKSETEQTDKEQAAEGDQGGEDESAEAKDKQKPDDRAATERRALAWCDEVDRDGFVEWTEVEHPDFEGKRVEVGGFVPLARTLPPHDQVRDLSRKHTDLLLALAGERPRLVLRDLRVEALGEDVYRVEVTAANVGTLPTMSAMGARADQLVRLELSLELPKGAKRITGSPRARLPVLASHGGTTKRFWLVRLKEAKSKTATLTLAAPGVGRVTMEVQFED